MQLHCVYLLSDGTSTQNSDFGYPKCCGEIEMGFRQIEQGFSSLFAKFLLYIFDEFSMWRHSRTLKNHQKWQDFGKKWRKFLFNLHSTHFLHWFLATKTVLLRPGLSLIGSRLSTNILFEQKINLNKKRSSSNNFRCFFKSFKDQHIFFPK